MDHSSANRALAYPSPAAFPPEGRARTASVVAERRGFGGKPEDDAVTVGLERGGNNFAWLGVGLLRLGDEPALLNETLDHGELRGRQPRRRVSGRFFRHCG